MDRRRFLADGLALPALLSVTPRAWPRAIARTEQSDERFEAVAQVIRDKMAENRIPGVAFGVVKDGRTLARGFGVASVEAPDPITDETIFPLASIAQPEVRRSTSLS